MMKPFFTLLLAFILGACRQELPASVSEVHPENSADDQLTMIEGKIDPDQLIVAAGESIKETSIPVLRVAKLYENYSGKKVIMSTEVAEYKFSFEIDGPLSNAEAARFLRLTLLTEGISMISMPGEENIVRLIPSGPIATSGGITKYYTHVSQLPDEDELVVFHMRFKHLDPDEGLKVFQASLGRFCDSGKIAAASTDYSLVITEKASFIRQMVKIQKFIDLSLSDVYSQYSRE